MKKYPLLLAALACLYSSITKADSNLFPFNPRASIWGGTGNNTYTRADAMIPLFGNTDGDIYTDLQGQWGTDKSWLGSVGLGGRQTFGDNLLLGAYSFIDRAQTVDSLGSSQWWVLNPGIEAMSLAWDGRLNFYLPMGDDQSTGVEAFGDQLGISHTVMFQGHQQYDGIYELSREIAKGADADIGYTFSDFYNMRAHGGGYYFTFPNAEDMHGGEGGISVPINHYTNLELDDSYDNIQKNTAVVSVRFSLGMPQNDFRIIQDRLLDPIYRHLGTLYTNSGIPQATSNVFISQQLERDNIWFFTQSGGSTFNSNSGTNNCTYENPCSGSSFTQANINAINTIASNTNLYFNPGTYSLGNFNLNSGQSIYGRNSNYALPAQQGSQPIFVGTLNLKGNNTLDSFALYNDGTNLKGINIVDANNVSMNNLLVGQLNNLQGFAQAIYLDNAQNISLSNSTINAYDDANSFTTGVYRHHITKRHSDSNNEYLK